MRWVLASIAVVVLLVAALAVYLLTNLDSLVESAIERYGSELTGTEVSVGSVEIALREGRGTLRDVVVANPPGYQAESAFSLGEITLDIDPGTVTGIPIVVDAVVVAAPEVTYEVDATLGSNIQTLLDNIERNSATGAQEPEAPAEGGQETRLRIRRFEFRDGRLAADTRAVGGKQVEAKLPPLVMNDVGGASGAAPSAVGAEVLGGYARSVIRTAARQEIDARLGDLQEKGKKKLEKEARKALEGLLD